MEEWLQLIMSGNSDLTVEVLKLLHAAAEADPQVQEAALEAAVLPALCDFLTEATQGRIGLHVDSSATAAACDLLDLFLMSAVLQDSTTAEESRSGESHLRVALNRELAASLARQLVAVLEKSESTAVSAACTICLYRLACMEDDPVPDVAEHCCQHSCKTEHSAREVFRSMASAETVGDHERSSGHRSTLQSEVSQHQAAYDTNLQPHHSLWHLAHSGGAVEAIVVAAATLACDGPAGSYWANVVAVIAVLSWVGAALVKAWKVRVSPQPGHTGTFFAMALFVAMHAVLATLRAFSTFADSRSATQCQYTHIVGHCVMLFKGARNVTTLDSMMTPTLLLLNSCCCRQSGATYSIVMQAQILLARE